jgi:hypothetical protein
VGSAVSHKSSPDCYHSAMIIIARKAGKSTVTRGKGPKVEGRTHPSMREAETATAD